MRPKRANDCGDRSNALWGRGSRGESRSNALWGRGGRRAGVAVAALTVPLAMAAGATAAGPRPRPGGAGAGGTQAHIPDPVPAEDAPNPRHTLLVAVPGAEKAQYNGRPHE